MAKTKKRAVICKYLLLAAITSLIVSLFDGIKWNWLSHISRICALVLIAIYLFLIYLWPRVMKCLCDKSKDNKTPCPFYTSDECPRIDNSQCQYDTTYCHLEQKDTSKMSKTRTWQWIVSIVCLVLILLGTLISDTKQLSILLNGGNGWLTLLKILQPIAISVLAAVLVSIVVDIPSRMREYQDYFVDLLSSSKYLKMMSEESLTSLRQKVTWQLHVKDFPNMPKGLIRIDERFCKMLKEPYYKVYSQSMSVHTDNNGNLRKNVKVEFTAYNPQDKSSAIIMDIGLSNSLKFITQDYEKEANNLFKLLKFSVNIDASEENIDIQKLIDIGVSCEQRNGTIYNGCVVLKPKKELSNRRNPFKASTIVPASKAQVPEGESKKTKVNYEMIEDSAKAGLYLEFYDKLKAKLEYEVIVPKEDQIYTKRLRYPVKYFHLDYSLSNDIKDMTLVGQIIGTQIDQPDVSTIISDDKKRISLQTHNWLLPKNGAVIVHGNIVENTKKEEKKQE